MKFGVTIKRPATLTMVLAVDADDATAAMNKVYGLMDAACLIDFAPLKEKGIKASAGIFTAESFSPWSVEGVEKWGV